MYSPSSGRTMIKVGGNDKSKVEPLYSIPIQTTTTLNIQLMPQRTSSTPTNQSSAQQVRIGGGGVGATSVRTSVPVNAAVTATRVNIVAEVPSKRSSSILSSDDSTSTLGTQTDGIPGGSGSYDVVRGSQSSNEERLLFSSSASQTGGFPGDPTGPTGVPGGLQSHGIRFHEAESQYGGFSETGSQVEFSDSGSQIGESFLASASTSTASESSSQTARESSSHTARESSSHTARESSSSAAPAGSSSSSSSSPTSSSSLNPWSASSMTTGGSVVTPVVAPLLTSSNGGRDAAEEGEASEYRVFNDVNGGKIGAGEATIKAKQLAQGIRKALTLNDGSREGQWKDTKVDDDDDDDDSDGGWEELGKPADPSTFNLIEWDLPNEKSSKQLACHRVIIMKDKEMVLMLKAACSTQKTGNDPRLLSLMAEIADNCSKRLKKMKTLPNLRAEHMDTLPLSDGRPTKEHLAAVSKALKDNIGIKEVAYRFQPADDVYMGTFVQGTILAKRNFAIGRTGVVAVLFKKSKYATVEAFSEQLCEHIAIAQPTTLGHLSDSDLKRLNRRGTTKIQHLQKDQLLVQNFIFDPTIIVAEAARRSFVRIDDFLLF